MSDVSQKTVPVANPLASLRLDDLRAWRIAAAYRLLVRTGAGALSLMLLIAATAAADDMTATAPGPVPLIRENGEGSGALPRIFMPLLPLPPSSYRPDPSARNERGIFLTAYSIDNPSFRDRSIERLKESGGDLIIFDVKGSAVHFDAENLALAKELGLHQPKYDLQEILAILREKNIRAIARYIAIKDHSLAQARPATQLEDPRTGRTLSPGYVDPADPMVLQYNAEVICALAAAGVEEVNLDYIRYRTEAAGSLSVFTKDEKVEKILTFVRNARDAIERCGPDTRLGISTFSVLGWMHDENVNGIGQDIRQLAPLVDVISPMAYNANFSLENPSWMPPAGHKGGRWHWLVYRTLTGYAEILGEEHAYKLRPWLQGWGAGTNEMARQMQAVYDAGACGFMVWSANNAYAPSYAAMEQVPVPEHCL